jgi:hypothetical protein
LELSGFRLRICFQDKMRPIAKVNSTHQGLINDHSGVAAMRPAVMGRQTLLERLK